MDFRARALRFPADSKRNCVAMRRKARRRHVWFARRLSKVQEAGGCSNRLQRD